MKFPISTFITAATLLMTTPQQATAAPAKSYQQADAEVFFQNGLNFFNEGNYTPAWVSFSEAAKIRPNEMSYIYIRACCCMSLRLYKAAVTDFNLALGLCKNNQEKGAVHFDLTRVYNLMQDDKNSLDHLVIAARLGYELAINICQESGVEF